MKSLRLLGTVGEPINPEAWMWYREHIGHNRCPIVDTWWQTETGMIMIAPLPGATPTKPGSATRPLPGVIADVVTREGESGAAGRRRLPGAEAPVARHAAHHLWRSQALSRISIGRRFPGMYFTGDGARKDEDGYFWIMGRIDDVINVSGHRLSTMEVESALVAHHKVAEAAVVARLDDLKGQAIAAFVTLKSGNAPSSGTERGVARVGGQGDRVAGQARRHPLHRRPAQDPQRQDHAPPAEGNRRRRRSQGRHDHAGRSLGDRQAQPERRVGGKRPGTGLGLRPRDFVLPLAHARGSDGTQSRGSDGTQSRDRKGADFAVADLGQCLSYPLIPNTASF